MADERKIVIELRAYNSSEDDNEEEGGNEDEEASKKRSSNIKRAVKQVATFAYNQISTQVLYDVNKYVSLSENYKASIVVDNVKTTISKVKSLAASTIGTAMLGAKIGNGWGLAAGALIGISEGAISIGLDLYRQYTNQSLTLMTNDINAGYSLSRLGLIDNGRGTYN